MKEIFADKGTITDVQLKYTKDGQFRRFGFIGFKDEEEAKAAREHFNNSFIKTCKISVEFCAALGTLILSILVCMNYKRFFFNY